MMDGTMVGERTCDRATPVWCVFCVALTLSLGGCARWTSITAMSVGPVAAGPSTFAQLQTVTQARGYRVLEANPASGTLRVAASTQTRRGEYSLTLQSYQEGWVSVIPAGPGVRREGDHWVVPEALASEYLDLSVALTSSLRQGSGGT